MLKIKRTIYVTTLLIGCVFAFLYYSSFVNAQTTSITLEDNQTVIVKSESVLEASDISRIGNTAYYSTTMRVARNLKTSDAIESIYIPQVYRLAMVPNDPYEVQPYLALLNAPAYWDLTTGSAESVVAIIDTGFELNHEDLIPTDDIEGYVAKWSTNPSEFSGLPNIDDDENGFVDDWIGWDFYNDDFMPYAGEWDPVVEPVVSHGTNVAGLVGAIGNNSRGIASLNWNTKILPLKIFDDDGLGYTDDLARAIAYAIDRDVDVINLSLGLSGSDPVIEDLIDQAEAAGIVVVAAAGNCDHPDYFVWCAQQGEVLFPASNNKTIAVAATTLTDEKAWFSSFGPAVDVAAPGDGAIISTDFEFLDPNGTYTSTLQGTSFSAPIVSGLVAALKSEWPTATNQDIRSLLTDTAVKINAMNGAQRTDDFGFGRISPLAATQRSRACKNATLNEDVNCDKKVDIVDLSLLVSDWQLFYPGRTDINKDTKTDIFDLSLLVSSWGEQ